MEIWHCRECHTGKRLLSAILLFIFLAGCRSSATDSTPQAGADDIFRPPPAAPQTPLVLPLAIPTLTAIPVEILPPTPTVPCNNSLRYLEDLTIPDGTQVLPGAQLDKQWRVENNGTCNWHEGYRLRLIEGTALGAAEAQALFPARAGTQATISVLFTAPMELGEYRSAWQAYEPGGTAFGDMIFIQIVVASQ